MLAKTHPYDKNVFQRYYSLLSIVWPFPQLVARRKEAQECHQHPQSPWNGTVTSLARSEVSPVVPSGWAPSPQTLLSHGLEALSIRQTRRRQPVWAQCPLHRRRRDVHRMERAATDPRGWRGSLPDTGEMRAAWTTALPKMSCPFALGSLPWR